MSIIRYINGNATIKLNTDDGTRIVETEDDEFDLEFPISVDLNIGNQCNGGCKYCYISASPNGVNADLMSLPFINTINPGVELALNGNSLEHPQLEDFLRLLKEKGIIANLTVNQIHFEKKIDLIRKFIKEDLIKGLGVSLRDPSPEFISQIKEFSNAVIHTIVGVLTKEDIIRLANNNLKLLILGYKDLGRGVDYKVNNYTEWEYNRNYLYNYLPYIVKYFKVISFDNLSLKQLDVKRILTPEKWERFYQGDDGTLSMFIDLVTGKFGVSSLCSESEMYPILSDIREMFKVVKKKYE